MRTTLTLSLAILFATILAAPLANAQLITTQAVFSGSFNYPRLIDFAPVPGKPGKVVMVYQDGLARLFDMSKPNQAPDTVLDLRSITTGIDERGLLGFAFHPDYPAVNKVYVNYTNNTPTNPPALATIIASIELDTARTRGIIVTRKTVLTFAQPANNHNGGKMEFGPDSTLYIASGDGGGANDPGNNGQKRTNLLGKILRIDVNRIDSGLGYKIPLNNPFYDSTGLVRREIYAYGLRNPWRFSWDAPTKRLWVADVGQNAWEEIDTVVAGGNYGWRLREGYSCLVRPGCADPSLKKPVFVYNHNTGDRSITGGYVYRGSSIPYLQNKYIYADYVTGKIYSLEFAGDTLMRSTLLLDAPHFISSFGRDANQELYYLSYVSGQLFKINAIPNSVTPRHTVSNLRIAPNPARATLGLTVSTLKTARISLMDVLGKQAFTLGEIPPNALAQTYTFAVGHLARGIYQLQIETETETVAQRVVLE